jgi:membrane protease YdiL (CAAX protease family)
VFGAEAVLYSEQGNWGDLFRRPREPADVATLPSVLLCLSVMFFVSYLNVSLLGGLVPHGPGALALGTAAGSLVLFLALPAFFAWMGRVRWREGFRLGTAGVRAWGPAVLLGLSLWPLTDPVRMVLAELGFEPFGGRPQAAGTAMREWRDALSPAAFVAALGVVPALVEELFFRGLLLGTLLRHMRPRNAIVTSALLFGFFHLVDQVLLERVIISTLLGLVLGWLAWRTGSIVPGMILHALHNSCLLLLLYYWRDLERGGWIERSLRRLPAEWVIAGAAGVVLAVVWVILAYRRPRPAQPPEAENPGALSVADRTTA